ncbi:probable leucine--tRNA ligase, mitochondrial, partial [Chrysoperla carnea]|uniref:probable leucine--tRNA ligase, mitochondrial n=1 Tax=Chrysoperla carnea TaxID=189513 RepID=UPI001D05F794
MNFIKRCKANNILRTKVINLSKNASTGISKWNNELTTSIKLDIENYWKNEINKSQNTKTGKKDDKYFVLSMFPYPSGKLHMGHVRVYTISDAVARYYRLNGKEVIHPMGWDAFGLPAENAAIEHNVEPSKWTQENIANMKLQLEKLGCSFDWSRELATCNPDYYKWTQDLFIKLFQNGLVYQKESLVNWDPIDQTVLADEQVDINGCSWRSGAKVEKKPLKQWFIRTTRFAKPLLDGLNDPLLDNWRDIIKLQRHWIGECNGVLFNFVLDNDDKEKISLWTAYPEYIEYCSFIAFSKKSYLSLKNNNGKITHAINPFTQEKVPILFTDEINYPEGCDSYIGIPFVSESDHDIATRNNFPIKNPEKVLQNEVEKIDARNEICSRAKLLNIGGYWCSSKLRDWLISRQRFWGTPIPIIHCKSCGPQPVPSKDLPIKLPELKKLSVKGLPPLLNATDWLHTNCPKCGGDATRETDTMDTFVDSSWYYLRYMDSKNEKEPFSRDQVMKLSPVDLYIGGKEHATLHLYYTRFLHHFLHYLDLVPEREPFKKLLVQGMVNGRTYRLKGSGKYLKENEIEIIDLKKGQAVEKSTKQPVVIAWEKMSKSKHNGVEPNYMFDEYSVDTTRLLILADVAPTSPRNWNTATFPGILNWQKRLWLTVNDFLKYRSELPPKIDSEKFQAQEEKLYDSRNYYITGVNFNICSAQQLSVAISKMQGLTNSLRQSTPDVVAYGAHYEHALAAQIIMLAPMAPHFASELWAGFISAPNKINNTDILWNKNVLEQLWPEVDSNYKCNLDFKVNGEDISLCKLNRTDLDKLTYTQAYELATNDEKLFNFIDNRRIVKIHFNLYKSCKAILHFIVDR